MELPRSTPEEQGIGSQELLAAVEAIAANPELHSVMVVRHGHVVAEGWAHPYSADRPHVLYSLSKTFTATAVGLAVAEGLVSLDDAVVDLFPEQAPPDVDERLARMTVRHLLTMTGGHDPGPKVDAPGDWVANFLAAPLVHEPGEHFVYDTLGTYVLSAVVQKVSGHRMTEYLAPLLLDPLGMVGVTSEVSPQGIDKGGLGMAVRTEDVARLGLLYLHDGLWDGRRVLPEGWVAQASAAQVPTADIDWDRDWRLGYGFQMWRSRHGYRMDGAFGQFCLVLPDEDAVVAITGAFGDTQRTLDAVWELVPTFKDEPLPPDDEAHAALTARLATLRLDPPAGQAITPTALRLSRRTVAFDDNPLGLVSASFAAAGVADELVVRWKDGAVTLHPGHEEPVPQRLTNPLEPQQSPDALVSGTWTGPDRYVLTVRFVGTPYAWTVTADVDGDRVSVAPSVGVSFGPTTFPTVTGTLQP